MTAGERYHKGIPSAVGIVVEPTITWFTTPDDLRTLARLVEERWAEVEPGGSLTVWTVLDKSGHGCLRICVDQSRMPDVPR